MHDPHDRPRIRPWGRIAAVALALGLAALVVRWTSTRSALEGPESEDSGPGAAYAPLGRRGGRATGPATDPGPPPVAEGGAGARRTVSGRVLDTQGSSVASAEVTAWFFDPRAATTSVRGPVATMVSLADGAWTLDLPADGPSVVHLLARTATLVSRLHPVDVRSEAARTDILLAVRAGGALRIRVRDSATGALVPDVTVRLTRALDAGIAPTDVRRTDGNGECVFEHVAGTVLVHVDRGDGFVFGRAVTANPSQETRADLAAPSGSRLLRVRWDGPGERSESPERAWAQLQVGRHSSGFWLEHGGEAVVRRHDAGDSDPLNLTMDLPGGGRVHHAWPALAQAAVAGDLTVRLEDPVAVTWTFVGEFGEPLPGVSVRAEQPGGRTYVPLHADEQGSVTTRMPRGPYVLMRSGRRIGDRTVDGATTPAPVVIPGQSALRGRCAPWPGDGLTVGLHLDGGTHPRTALPPALAGGSPAERPGSTEYEAFTREATWAVTVPWPQGTPLTLSLQVRGRRVGPTIACRAGDDGLELTGLESIGRVTVVPRLGAERYLLGEVALIPESVGGRGAGESTETWMEALRAGPDAQQTALLDAQGRAEFWTAVPGRYRLEYRDPSSPGSVRTGGPLDADLSGQVLEAELR